MPPDPTVGAPALYPTHGVRPRAPCSDIRLAGRVTFRGKARGKSPRRPESDVSPGRIGPGGRATARAVAERTPEEASREGPRRKPMSGTLEEPVVSEYWAEPYPDNSRTVARYDRPMSADLFPLRLLLLTLAGWINRHQQQIIEYLMEENRVLKEQLKGRRLRLTDDQRRRLAVKGQRLGRRVLRRSHRAWRPRRDRGGGVGALPWEQSGRAQPKRAPWRGAGDGGFDADSRQAIYHISGLGVMTTMEITAPTAKPNKSRTRRANPAVAAGRSLDAQHAASAFCCRMSRKWLQLRHAWPPRFPSLCTLVDAVRDVGEERIGLAARARRASLAQTGVGVPALLD
jgi:hypothetical protein